jgi:hypothetical protein
MNVFKTLALLVFGAMLLTSCTSSLDEILVANDGRWNVDETKVESYVDGQLDADESETITNDGIMDFEESTVTWTNAQNETFNFNWTYDAEMETITLDDDTTALTFDVISSDKNAQEWNTEFEFEFFGTNFRTDISYKLSKL